jgi:NhaA family Na+:H+ antiporter
MPARSDHGRQPPLAPTPLRLPLALREFLREETSGGVALVAAAIIALAWANSPWRGGYEQLWATELSLRLGRFALAADLRHWVTDGLMTVFFLVVGLEIKREAAGGGMWRAAAPPVVAAAGGMALPALIYAAFNLHRPGAPGWGVPMATDVAFALAVLALLGPRVPAGLKVFLLTLAVADDLGSVLVVAGFYHRHLDPAALVVAVAVVASVWLLGRVGVWWLPVHVTLGAALWLALRAAGVSPALAGVAMGLLAPARPTTTPGQVRERVLSGGSPLALHPKTGSNGEGERGGDGGGPGRAARLREVLREARGTVPLAERLAHDLHPFSAFVAVPSFALANAGVHLGHGALGGAGSGAVLAGILAGRLLGKPLGITAAAWLAVRAGIGTLPEGTTWRQLGGVGLVAGVGFTVPLFVAELAFPSARFAAAVRLGLLLATVGAAAGGALLLVVSQPGPGRPAAGGRGTGRW